MDLPSSESMENFAIYQVLYFLRRLHLLAICSCIFTILMQDINEEHGLCYGVKRANVSRSGTSQKPTNTNTKSTPTQKHKSHVL